MNDAVVMPSDPVQWTGHVADVRSVSDQLFVSRMELLTCPPPPTTALPGSFHSLG